jgi:hypothetical protein
VANDVVDILDARRQLRKDDAEARFSLAQRQCAYIITVHKQQVEAEIGEAQGYFSVGGRLKISEA